MPICPNCGSFVSEGSPVCSCGTSISYSRREEETEENPEEIERMELAREYYLEACSLERQGRYGEALRMYEKSRDLGHKGFTTYDRGLLYYEMGDYERALELFRKCTGMGKAYHMPRMIGKALTGLGRYDEALDMYFKTLGIIEKSDDFIQDYTSPNFGRYYTKEELDLMAMEKRARKRKEQARVYREIALTCMHQKRYRAALKYADEAIDFEGENARNWNVKAIILEDMGRLEKAKECYDRAIELEDHRVYIENKALMIMEWCRSLYENDGDLFKAESLIDEAIDELSTIQTDVDIVDYRILRNDIRDRIDFRKKRKALKAIGRENLITIAGTSYFGYPNFEEGMPLKLVRERDNDFEANAIAVYSGDSKVGYVANSTNASSEMSSMASDLDIPDTACAVYLMRYELRFHIAQIIECGHRTYELKLDLS